MATVTPDTLAELLEQLGGVPLNRILMRPAPGNAQPVDVLHLLESSRKRICELVDGVLVEKPMGTKESYLAGIIYRLLADFLDEHDLGIVTPGDGPYQLMTEMVRFPDVAFVSWESAPNGLPESAIARIVPDLAVEVLSASNTRGEMQRKVRDYFLAGVRLVWIINPKTETAEVFTTPDEKTRVGKNGFLEGHQVLPGLRLSLAEIFARANRKPPQPRKTAP